MAGQSPHEFTYANLGHGEKDLFISACGCGASRILTRIAGKRWVWKVVEQEGKLPVCTCPQEEEEEGTMHPIEGFHHTPPHFFEGTNDKE